MLYPDSGFTKSQVIDYYARIAEVMLPHLVRRPATFKRYPNGVDGMFFYEKHSPASAPEWVRTISVPSKDGSHEPIEYTEVRDRATAEKRAGKTAEQAADAVNGAMNGRYPDRGRLTGAVKAAYAEAK